MATTLITGASGGIGRELALICAAQGHDLVVVARSQDKLETLATHIEKTYQTSVTVITADLTQSDDVNHVYSTCKTKDIHIDNLINNAGFGGYGAYEQASRDQHTDMIDLNIIALMRLTYLFLDDMKAAGHGRILQVASTAGMVPGPMQAVYHATKAFVVSLTDSLAIELEDTDITITALCPGPVETGFAEQADVADVAAFQSAADATTVAQDGYDAMMAGELFRISGLPRYYRMMIRLMPLLPRSLVVSQIKQSVTKSS